MGIGQVIVLRVPPNRLRMLNIALERGAWGAYQTEFYIKKVISDTDHNWTFAAHWYLPDHPGLAGRDLTPKGNITDILNQPN